MGPSSTCLKDARITRFHSRGRMLFYTARSRKGLPGGDTWRDMEGMIKSAASAASRKTKLSGPRPREVPRPATVRLPSRRVGASLDLGPPDLVTVFLEAALAADVITAFKSKQRTPRRSQNQGKGSQTFPNPIKHFPKPSKSSSRLWIRSFSNPCKTTKGRIS